MDSLISGHSRPCRTHPSPYNTQGPASSSSLGAFCLLLSQPHGKPAVHRQLLCTRTCYLSRWLCWTGCKSSPLSCVAHTRSLGNMQTILAPANSGMKPESRPEAACPSLLALQQREARSLLPWNFQVGITQRPTVPLSFRDTCQAFHGVSLKFLFTHEAISGLPERSPKMCFPQKDFSKSFYFPTLNMGESMNSYLFF